MKNLDDLYFLKYENNNIIYSIDKIRLKTFITYSKFSNIEFLIDTSYKDKVKKFWLAERIECFHYNYSIDVEEGKNVYIGFMHNTEKAKYNKEEAVYNLTLEFNPNKIKDNSFLMYLLGISGDWYLIRYDMAFDVPISILDLITDMSGRNFERVDNRGYDNKTIYLGKGDGRVKVYNKKRESDLNLVGDLTRIEITREIDDFEIRKVVNLKYDDNFPIVYTNNYMFSFSDYKNKTVLAILYAVQNGFPLRDLSRDYRKKIKEMLEGGYKIKFSNKVATDLLRQIIFKYFMPNKNIHWY